MKNSRQTEFRSLKGPKRKLTLEVIDGKRYIKKRDLQHYFFDEKWTIDDFNYHFGLGHRIVRGSLCKWFTKDEIDKSHREKIAEKQKGDRNSNNLNWYRPKKLIPLELLESTIRGVTNKRELKEKLNLTSFELSSIQQFYNLRLPNKNTLIDDFSKNHLSKKEIEILAKFLFITDHYEAMLSDDRDKIYKALDSLICIQYELKYVVRKLRKYYREYSCNVPSNVIEYQFYKILKKKVDRVVPQFFIRDLNIHVDFLINDKYVLELDGMLHDIESDKERDNKLVELGYEVIRIDLKKEKVSRFANHKDIKKCLENKVLPKLNQ